VIPGYVAVLGKCPVTCVLAGRVVMKRVGWVRYLHSKVSEYRLSVDGRSLNGEGLAAV
jgi:hypothetical protein